MERKKGLRQKWVDLLHKFFQRTDGYRHRDRLPVRVYLAEDTHDAPSLAVDNYSTARARADELATVRHIIKDHKLRRRDAPEPRVERLETSDWVDDSFRIGVDVDLLPDV